MTKIVALSQWGENDSLLLVTAQGELLLVVGDADIVIEGEHTNASLFVRPVRLFNVNTRLPLAKPRPAPEDVIEAAYVVKGKTVWQKHVVMFVGTRHFQHHDTLGGLETKAYNDEGKYWRWPEETT